MIMLQGMSREERIDLATKLLNEQMNDTLQRWSDEPEKLKDYAWGWRNKNEVGNNHGSAFFYADDVIKILKALELDWFLLLAMNDDGELTPTIHFH